MHRLLFVEDRDEGAWDATVQRIAEVAGDGEVRLERRPLDKLFPAPQPDVAALIALGRAAGKTDSTLNAVVLLDLFAIIVPAAVDDRLQDIRTMLAPYIEGLRALAAEDSPA